MTRQRHLHRTAVLAAASAAVFAATATGSALAWNGSVHPIATTSPVVSATTPASIGDAPATRAIAAPTARRAVAAAAPAASVTAPTRTATRTLTRTKATTARVTTAKATPSVTTAKAASPRAARAKAAASSTITISRYVDSPGSQAAIDKCKLVLWTTSPMWLAGHNWCGYQWMAFVKTGATVKVSTGQAAGTYVVTGHLTLTRQSGALPHLDADLVLQTCIGSGTGLTLLHRV